jgi:hypothetical protein
MTKTIKYAPLGALLCLCAAPALADHAGPAGFGSGGGMTVFSPDTLDAGHWAAGLRLAYTRPEQRSDAALAALAGDHVHAHNTDYNLNGALSVAYGITHHLTVSAQLPYVRRDDLREGEHAHGGGGAVNGVAKLGSVSGIGDASLLAKYRLTEGEGVGFALIGGVKLPTGATHQHSPDGERLETEHQPGTGSWDPIVGASASARTGAVQWTASGLYQFSTGGAQATRLGDRFQGGVAVSHRFAGAQPPSRSITTRRARSRTIITTTKPKRRAPIAGTGSSNSPANGKAGRKSAARSRRRAAASGPMSRPACASIPPRDGRRRRRSPFRSGSGSAHRTPTIDIG